MKESAHSNGLNACSTHAALMPSSFRHTTPQHMKCSVRTEVQQAPFHVPGNSVASACSKCLRRIPFLLPDTMKCSPSLGFGRDATYTLANVQLSPEHVPSWYYQHMCHFLSPEPYSSDPNSPAARGPRAASQPCRAHPAAPTC